MPDSELDARRATLTADSLATLIYTSGTTGRPKGCELTHANFLFEIGNGMTLLGRFMNVQGSLLLFIPLAHVLARVLQVGAVKTRTVIGHTPDVKNLVAGPRRVQADLRARRPARVREGLQQRQGQGRGRRQGQDLRQGRPGRHRLVPRPGHGRRRAWR